MSGINREWNGGKYNTSAWDLCPPHHPASSRAGIAGSAPSLQHHCPNAKPAANIFLTFLLNCICCNYIFKRMPWSASLTLISRITYLWSHTTVDAIFVTDQKTWWTLCWMKCRDPSFPISCEHSVLFWARLLPLLWKQLLMLPSTTCPRFACMLLIWAVNQSCCFACREHAGKCPVFNIRHNHRMNHEWPEGDF